MADPKDKPTSSVPSRRTLLGATPPPVPLSTCKACVNAAQNAARLRRMRARLS